jgi:hypothetical protein
MVLLCRVKSTTDTSAWAAPAVELHQRRFHHSCNACRNSTALHKGVGGIILNVGTVLSIVLRGTSFAVITQGSKANATDKGDNHSEN